MLSVSCNTVEKWVRTKDGDVSDAKRCGRRPTKMTPNTKEKVRKAMNDKIATATVRSCFAALRQIRSIRRCLPRNALLSLIRALVVSKVDYCCSVLAGVSRQLLYRLQSILNAAA